jgi:glucose/arabinose dehydrogenase
MKRAIFIMVLGLAVAVSTGPVFAHPPDDPYDDTVFAPIKPGGFRLDFELLANGLTAPLKALTAPTQPGRLFVVDQVGILWTVDLETGAKSVFLDVSDRLVPLGVLGPDTFDERGFLGVTFHPDYATNGRLYTYTSEPDQGEPTFPTTLPPESDPDHQNVVAEWTVPTPEDPAAVVDPGSRRELLRVDWPQFNHDGGDLAFGPEGMLYISMGDGGGADDRDGQLFTKATGSFPEVVEPIVGHGLEGNAQKLTNPLGKILRIDPDGSNSANGQYGIPAANPFVGAGNGVVEEIFAFGFRNPYRFSFDPLTGGLIVGDVGQNDIEEIDVVTAAGNYGWNHKEGTLFFDHNGDDPGFATTEDPGGVPANLIDPIAQYDIHFEGHSVIGGFVYRGEDIPQLTGRYVFGEFSRLFNFPSGPHNFGRLLYLSRQPLGNGLHRIFDSDGFEEAAERLGLSDPSAEPGPFPQTLAVLGMGSDAQGELYVLGNISGVPFGDEGVVLRIAPAGGS